MDGEEFDVLDDDLIEKVKVVNNKGKIDQAKVTLNKRCKREIEKV